VTREDELLGDWFGLLWVVSPDNRLAAVQPECGEEEVCLAALLGGYEVPGTVCERLSKSVSLPALCECGSELFDRGRVGGDDAERLGGVGSVE